MERNIRNLVLISAIAVIVSIFLIYFAFFKNNAEKFLNEEDGVLSSNKLNEAAADNDSIYGKDFISDNEETNAAGGGGSGGNSAGAGGTSEAGESEVEQQSEQLLCLVARPGNIEGIECSVNFIQSDSISLKITNNADEDIFVDMVLEGCSNEATSIVSSGGEANFVFLCNAEDYFEESLSLIYTINSNVIKVNGIVSGPVS